MDKKPDWKVFLNMLAAAAVAPRAGEVERATRRGCAVLWLSKSTVAEQGAQPPPQRPAASTRLAASAVADENDSLSSKPNCNRV